MKKIFISLFLLCVTLLSLSQPVAEKIMTGFTYNSPVDETIYYTRKVDSSYAFEGALPDYTYHENNNACGPVAGAVALGYYDRQFPDLIPNYIPTSISKNTGKLIYASQNTEVNNVISQLITKMNAQNGVTVSNFKSGLTSYVSGKGLKTSYSSAMSPFLIFWSRFDYGKYVNEINAGKPVVLCLDEFHIGNIGTVGNVDQQRIMTSKNKGHMMVGFGYRTIKYYRYESWVVWTPTWLNPFKTTTVTEEVNFRTDAFLMAVTGQGDMAYLNINKNISFNDAFSVNIYK